MRPRLDPRAARVCTAVGALSAVCTLAVDGHAAASTTSLMTHRPGVPVDRWTQADPLLAGGLVTGRLFGERHHRVSATARAIRRMRQAANRIARLPYAYGGGHGSFTASGYDCSGSVSYVLHAAGLLSVPEDSIGLESFGAPGPGRHVTIYANGGHAWMTIDGRRFDTIALQETGTRWSSTISSSAGYTVRHPRGF
jgi:hypothetical protein